MPHVNIQNLIQLSTFDPKNIRIEDYSYDLPDEKIAKFPLEQRDHSNLLIYKDSQITHTKFYELHKHLPADSLLVVNNTKVVYARLIFHKPTGAKIEIFLLNPVEPAEYNKAFSAKGSSKWSCIVGNFKKWKNSTLTKTFTINEKEYTITAERIGKTEDSQIINFTYDNTLTFSEVLDNVGLVPIPPYLNREAVPQDKQTYQTVYSKLEGSVAAPTAGLHFTESVLEKLQKQNITTAEVTLHVGAGTFKPVKTPTIGGHPMHTEYFTVTKDNLLKLKEKLGDITSVGTTTLRTLESLYWLANKLDTSEKQWFVGQWEPYETRAKLSPEQALDKLIDWLDKNGEDKIEAWTQIIIVPGYKFKIVDRLITNFHQPRSTLLLLVAAFVGEDWRKIYDYALKNNFRFLSYGDSSLLWKNN